MTAAFCAAAAFLLIVCAGHAWAQTSRNPVGAAATSREAGPNVHGQAVCRTSGRVALAACGLLWFGGLTVPAQTKSPNEYQVKAVFLFNFAQFVEWPAGAFGGAKTPIVIGVLGQNPFGSYLEDTVRGETVEDRPLEVQQYRRVEDIKNCHILFISRSEVPRLKEILLALKHRSILIVGDDDDFVERGGMIRLATARNRVRLIINADAAMAAMLTISSQLLRSADLVAAAKE